LPWHQNFLAHSTYKYYLDINALNFTTNASIPIDCSSFKNTGMTLQHLLEYKVMTRAVENIYKKFIENNPKENIQFVFKNSNDTSKPHSYQVSQIQANPDAHVIVYYSEKGAEKSYILSSRSMPLDSKIIQYPGLTVQPNKGQVCVSVTTNDAIPYIDRTIGGFSNILTTELKKTDIKEIPKVYQKFFDVLKEFQHEFKKEAIIITKKESSELLMETLINRKMPAFHDILIQLLLNKDNPYKIFPSLVMYNFERTSYLKPYVTDEFVEFLKKVRGQEALPQRFFPEMGRENYVEYKEHILRYIDCLPKLLRDDFMANYEIFLSTIKTLAIGWKP